MGKPTMLRQLVVETVSRNQHQGSSDLVLMELSPPNLVALIWYLCPVQEELWL